jgi:hypothetical protein
VLYTPIHVGATSYADKPKLSPYAGLSPSSREVEVTPGSNEIVVELVRRSKKA